MISNPRIGMAVETLPPPGRGKHNHKWEMGEKARRGRIVYLSRSRWFLAVFQGKLGDYREAFFPMDVKEA